MIRSERFRIVRIPRHYCNGPSIYNRLCEAHEREEVIEEVKSKLTKIEEAQVELRSVHEQLDGLLTEDWEKEEAEAYLYSVVQRSDEAVKSS